VKQLGIGSPEVELPVALEDVELPRPRLEPPSSLAEPHEASASAATVIAMARNGCGFRREFSWGLVMSAVARPKKVAS